MDAPRNQDSSKPDSPSSLISSETLGLIAAIGLLVLMATRQWQPAAAVVVGLVVLVIGLGRGWWRVVSRWLGAVGRELWRRLMLALWRRKDIESELTHVADYEYEIGIDVETGKPVTTRIPEMGNIGMYGISRYGKTTQIHSMIHQLISQYPPSRLVLLISDPKTIDYPIYRNLAHLRLPIARTKEETEELVKWAEEEMERRSVLFDLFSRQGKVCNSLDRYHELGGEQLPLVLLIFDELADVVDSGSAFEKRIALLGKKGLGYGIHLYCATQRPSAAVVNGEIKSQMLSTFCTFMRDPREFGVVAQIPKHVYTSEHVGPIKGRLIVYTPELQWRIIQGKRIPYEELERVAARYSGRKREWVRTAADDPVTIKPNLREGTEEEKNRRVLEWLRGLDERPSRQAFCEQFDCAEKTATKYLNRLWDESRRGREVKG